MPSKLGQMMNELIRGEIPQPSPAQGKSDEIRGLYKQGLQQLRGQCNMHPEARRVEIARLYATTRASLAKVRKDQDKADADNFTKLERQLWGYADVHAHAPTAAERATVDAAIRDAQDRAAKLTKPDQAKRALADAEQAGDKVLARAVAKRAHDMDWTDVVADYLTPRDTASRIYNQLCDIHQRQNTDAGGINRRFAETLAKPDELRGLSDKDIAAMTADPGDAAA
jgi:hypothetical protein